MGISIPDEGKALPPPTIVNRNSLCLAGIGWCTAMFANCLAQRPPLKSGAHRQALFATIGWFFGYHLTKIENYTHAKRDQEMLEYVKLHPDEFGSQEKRKFSEIVDRFYPVR